MGRFKSNVLAQPHCHRPPRDSLDLAGRLSGSLAEFKFAISAGFEKIRSDSFRKAFTPRPIPLFQKMRGWLRLRIALRHVLEGLALEIERASLIQRPHNVFTVQIGLKGLGG